MASKYCTRVFGQLQGLMDRHQIKAIIKKHKSDYRVRVLFAWQHLQVMILYQFCFAQSLRDMISSYRSSQKLHQLVGLDHLARSTFSDANTHRAAAVFGDIFTYLYGKLINVTTRQNQARKFKDVFLVDSTLIKLTLAMIHWASYRKQTAAIKLHFMLKLLEEVPAQVKLTVGRMHDVNKLAQLTYLKGMTYIFDRGYLAYDFLAKLIRDQAFFIVRFKKGNVIKVTKNLKLPKTTEYADFTLLSDQMVLVGGVVKKIIMPLRLVTFETNEGIIMSVLTNRFDLSAQTIALLYQKRWQIELFFRWIKQHLKVKTFMGTCENAVLVQIFTALITYVLLNLLKVLSGYSGSLYELLREVKNNYQATLRDIVGTPLHEALQAVDAAAG